MSWKAKRNEIDRRSRIGGLGALVASWALVGVPASTALAGPSAIAHPPPAAAVTRRSAACADGACAQVRANAQALACTDCHHPGGAPVPHATGCTDTSCAATCHTNIDLSQLAHLSGPGTPLTADRTTTCNNCHNQPFDGVYHPYTINVSAGAPTPAGVVDLDQACGRCHGGGMGQLPGPTHATAGDMAAGSTVVTVADGTGFLAGQRARVSGAGPLGADLEATIVSIAGTTIDLAAVAGSTVTGAAVRQNPPATGVPYYSKAQLAPIAAGIHDHAGANYPISFTVTAGSPDTLAVVVDAMVSCGGVCPTFTYDWSWGDGTDPGTSDPDAHTYAGAGAKSITLVVRLAGKLVGYVTRSVNLTNPDLPPIASASCAWNGNTWTMAVSDGSSDDGADADMMPPDGTATTRVRFEFGDGTLAVTQAAGSSSTHLYAKPGTFPVSVKAIDAKLQSATFACPAPATPAYFSIDGTVKNVTGATSLAAATVQLVSGSTIVKSVLTGSTGAFSLGSLKPGTYTLRVVKSGYTFASPAATVTVGPSSPGNILKATNK